MLHSRYRCIWYLHWCCVVAGAGWHGEGSGLCQLSIGPRSTEVLCHTQGAPCYRKVHSSVSALPAWPKICHPHRPQQSVLALSLQSSPGPTGSLVRKLKSVWLCHWASPRATTWQRWCYVSLNTADLNSCDCYKAGEDMRQLPCGGCAYCKFMNGGSDLAQRWIMLYLLPFVQKWSMCSTEMTYHRKIKHQTPVAIIRSLRKVNGITLCLVSSGGGN